MRRIGAAGAGVVAALVGAVLLSGCVPAEPKPGPPTAKEVDAYVTRMLDATWASSGLDGVVERPSVKAAPVESPEKFSDDLTRCYEKAGYELRGYSWGTDQGYQLSENNDVYVDDPDKQLAFYTCLARHPADPVASGELLGDDQLTYQYAHFTGWVIPCLRASGYTLDYVPTRKEYLDGMYWGPYSSVEGVDSPNKYTTLTTRCGPERVEFSAVAAG